MGRIYIYIYIIQKNPMFANDSVTKDELYEIFLITIIIIAELTLYAQSFI